MKAKFGVGKRKGIDMPIDATKIRLLKWAKYVTPDEGWAYQPTEDGMELPAEKIFRLHWPDGATPSNVTEPKKGDLVLLLQDKHVTHLAELIEEGSDAYVYRVTPGAWRHRVAKALWVPPGNEWRANVPSIRAVFGYEKVAGDGDAHNLERHDRMADFHAHWDPVGGLTAFQDHVLQLLNALPSA
jgi:hypothetical protein